MHESKNSNAITIAAQHKDGGLARVELAFRQARMGKTSGSHTLKDDSNSIELQEFMLGLSPSRITTIPNAQEQRHSSPTHTGHGVANLGLPQGLTPKMLENTRGG